ncbi:NAD-dependent epimerase/dehydratase family protein [Brevundimonas sp. M20]|uniref:NAD-dependent epimerase/dehydratase family protein n=1 Tax=Brevundimonas sp. M20 TaxID=2591463 RepID=UPI00197AD437|nr:NAD-dependent epimerase/dehydratase family protein [Brevundimonas sp. M20]
MTEAGRLEFVAADLLSDAGCAEALAGVDVLFHIASPARPGRVADENELIVPSVDGALRVLRAAPAARVDRVVLTSAFHTVSWGHRRSRQILTEADWTNPEGPGVDAYGQSKTLAERAAWAFMAAEGGANDPDDASGGGDGAGAGAGRLRLQPPHPAYARRRDAGLPGPVHSDRGRPRRGGRPSARHDPSCAASSGALRHASRNASC